MEKVGWNVLNADGHDADNLAEALNRNLDDKAKPLLVIAKTTAGKDVSFMEGKVEWQYLPQTDEQHLQALDDVGQLLLKVQAR